MDENELREFLRANPKYRDILQRAVVYEEQHANDRYYTGWSWSNVRAYPGELMKLVREGIIDISYKSRKYTDYSLVDRELTKRLLGL